MRTFGINLFIDGIVATIACVAIHLLGVSVSQEWSTIIVGLLFGGLACMIGSDLLEEKRRARKK